MKPGEEMHSAVEEVDVDPCDLYLDLGALIVEGRIPGLTDRGFGEGPHCPPAAAPVGSVLSRHHCNTESLECQRYEQMQKHMLLLWKNSIPMSIEVLLYPNCCGGSAPIQNVDTSSLTDMSYILLEQWTVHMLPRRLPDATINPRGLIQAIRSFLCFSQLCAWYSLTGGKSPQNIHFRVCVPGEAFSSRFTSPPNCHVFPIANIGRNAAMKVLVKSHPRFGEIPIVPCPKHPLSALQLKTMKLDLQPKEEDDEPLLGAEGEFIDGILPLEAQNISRTNSPADSMLGESLLDPPNSLCMYPRRYQSPSRCGSPSLEVPEHLMFGKGAATKRDSQWQRLNRDMQNRSRPIHRPVFQRVLEKNLSDGLLGSSPSSSSPKNYDNHFELDMLHSLDKDFPYVNDQDLKSYLCNDLKDVSEEEMENILQRLRNNQSSRSHEKVVGPYRLNQSEKFNLLNKQMTLEGTPPKVTHNTSKVPYNLKKYGYAMESIKPSFQRIQKSLLSYKPDISSKHSKKNIDFNKLGHVQLNSQEFCLSKEKETSRLKDNYFYDPYVLFPDMQQASKTCDSGVKTRTYRSESPEHDLPASFTGVNIKKCGALLQTMAFDDKLIDERKIVKDNLSQSKLSKPKSPETMGFLDDLEYSNHIPSAEDKAQFRRSLDSATSLVFHQKNGLPLTSSPAPIRKSGTCFDFDSSLTSVSAIKRALFEKEPDDETEAPMSLHSSTSAPSSMTVSSLLGTFEESVLNGRLEPVSTVEGFTAEIGASGSFCPRHITLPVTIFFYTLQDIDKVTSPYLGHINLGKKDYHVPKMGTVQVTLFNPHRTVVKMFVVRYDLNDMPPNCQTFLRQRTLYMPSDASENNEEAQKWLRYLIHLRFSSSKSGRIYLHTDIRMIIFRKSDLDAATVHGQRPYELKSFTQGPLNPKFSPRKLSS